MSNLMIPQVFEVGLSVVERIRDTQSEQIDSAARAVANCFLGGHNFFVSGSGHSHTFTEELYGRAGGLAFTKPILTSELTLTEHPTKSSLIERLDGYGSILAELYGIVDDGVVLIASNSGRNAYPVELAMAAKKQGAQVIALTNFAHSTATKPRNKAGKRLMEVADIVIDNCGVPGDSALEVPGVAVPMCPTSSIANAFIAQAISVQAAVYIAEAGVEPPVFVSLNNEGTEHVNDELFKRYTRLY